MTGTARRVWRLLWMQYYNRRGMPEQTMEYEAAFWCMRDERLTIDGLVAIGEALERAKTGEDVARVLDYCAAATDGLESSTREALMFDRGYLRKRFAAAERAFEALDDPNAAERFLWAEEGDVDDQVMPTSERSEPIEQWIGRARLRLTNHWARTLAALQTGGFRDRAIALVAEERNANLGAVKAWAGSPRTVREVAELLEKEGL